MAIDCVDNKKRKTKHRFGRGENIILLVQLSQSCDDDYWQVRRRAHAAVPGVWRTGLDVAAKEAGQSYTTTSVFTWLIFLFSLAS